MAEFLAIGTKLQTALRSRELSPASYDHLSKLGAARRVELEQEVPA
jgi:hypothetical protein